MEILNIDSAAGAEKALKELGVSARGVEIMVPKALFQVIRLEKVDTRAANILKQTMLSQGAECAVSAATVNLAAPYTDVLLMGTAAQLEAVLPRLREQPWGLKKIAEELAVFLQEQLEKNNNNCHFQAGKK